MRVSELLVTLNQPAEALKAADAGLAACPSAQLYTSRAEALDRLHRIYDLRRTLAAGAIAYKDDVDLLRRRAAVEDGFGSRASAAYADLISALEHAGAAADERQKLLVRALQVSLRDREWQAASRFAEQLKALGKPEYSEWVREEGATGRGSATVPGGMGALVFIARAKKPDSPSEALVAYARSVAPYANEPKDVFQSFQESIRDHFARIASLSAMGTRQGDNVVLHLSTGDKKARQSTQKALELLGWNMKSSNAGVKLEPAVKGAAAGRHETASALAFDELAMQEALQAGKSFDIEIPYESVPAFPDERTWRDAFARTEQGPGGLAELLVRDPRIARLYIALNTMGHDTAAVLISEVGLKSLAERYSGVLEQFSSALALSSGAVAVPGGVKAEPVWTKLTGASPREPGPFFRSLLDKDHGRLLAFYSILSQLDTAHQAFYTRVASRSARFYELFQAEPEAAAVEKTSRDRPFLEFLRDVPLTEDGSVDFPGSPEVWMVVNGTSRNSGKTAKLIRKLKKTATPDVEDDILIRLAKTRYKAEGLHHSELDNFLAVVRIDSHRAEPLDEASAILLAERYHEYRAFYPYFSVLTALGEKEFTAFFTLGERMSALDDRSLQYATGEIQSLFSLLSLGVQSGAVPQERATALFPPNL